MEPPDSESSAAEAGGRPQPASFPAGEAGGGAGSAGHAAGPDKGPAGGTSVDSAGSAGGGWLFQPSSLGGSFRIYLPCVLVMRLLGLARMLVFAYLILKTEYGLQRLALQLINLLVAVARVGVPAGVERYVPQYERSGQLNHFIRRGLWLGTLVAAGVTLLLAAAAPWLAALAFRGSAGAPGELPPSAGYLLQVTLACLGVTLVLAVYMNLQGVLRGLRMYRALAVKEVLHGLTFLVFAVAGLFLSGVAGWSGGQWEKARGAATVLVLAYGFSLLATGAFLGVLLLRHMGRWNAQRRPLGESVRRTVGLLFRYSSYVTGSNILWTTTSIYALWYVNKLHGEAEAGQFALPRDLLQAIQFLGLTIWPVAQNSANRLWEQGHRDLARAQLRMVFRLSGWVLWLICAALVLGREWVVRLMPPEYAGAGPLIPWLAAYFLVQVNLGMPGSHALLLEKTRFNFTAAATALAVLALSAWWLVPQGRALGAAQSGTAAGAAALAVLLLLVTLRQGRGWLSWRELLLLAAPALLFLPTMLGPAGSWLLVGAVAGSAGLLAFTATLWSRDDRRLLGEYLRASLAIVTGRARRGG